MDADGNIYESPDPPTADIERLREQLENVSHREREVVEMYYGLEGRERHSHEQIADVFGVTPERVRQVRKQTEKAMVQRVRESDA